MSLTARRFVALIFILLFLAGAPILILYTAGYRYNFKKAQLQKAGALVLKSEPSGADVFLNGEDANETTPIRLNNLLPDEYEVRLEKKNYYSWTKKITIKQQETSFAEDIVLFKKTNPEPAVEQSMEWVDFSADGKFATYIINEENQGYLYLLNLGNQKTRLLYNNNQTMKSPFVSWSADGSYLLFTTDGENTILSTFLPKQTITLQREKDQPVPFNFKWSDDNSGLLFWQANNDIYGRNALTGIVNKFFSAGKDEKLLDYFIYGKEIFLIEKISDKTILTKQPLDGGKQVFLKSIELNGEHYRFGHAYRGRLSIFDEDTQSFYLANLDLDKILFNKSGVVGVDLHREGKLLLVATSQELSYIDLSESDLRETIITRYSQGLTSAHWHYSSNYVFALQDGKLTIIELDDRGGRQTFTLPADNVSTFSPDVKAKALFYRQKNALFIIPLE